MGRASIERTTCVAGRRRAWFARLVAGVSAAWLVCAAALAQQEASQPASGPTAEATSEPASEPSDSSDLYRAATAPSKTGPKSTSPAAIERFTGYYLALFDKYLKTDDWVARTMVVIGLARLDDPRTTAKLTSLMDKDAHPAVQIASWEALHARLDRLTPAQRTAWETAGFRLAGQSVLRGDLRLGVLGLIEAQGPTPKNKEILKQLFTHTNSMDPRDIHTLEKMGDILKKWQSPDIIKGLITGMGNLDDAYRAELVLHRISHEVPYSYKAPALPAGEKAQTWYTTLYQEGSKTTWEVTQKRWADWYEKQKFKDQFPPAAQAYTGTSDIMPAGEKMEDTRDEKWRKDLELTRFRLGQLDMGLAVDTTASLGPVLHWVQRDVVKMMSMFELISREPRMGIVLYRDYGDKYLTAAMPLTDRAATLAAELRKATAAGGGDIPEAVYEGLEATLNKLQWSGPDAKKVIVLIGDAPPHEDSMGKIEKLVKDAVAKGFTFHCIKVHTQNAALMVRALKKKDWDPQLTSFDKIAEWGNGSANATPISFMEETLWGGSGTAVAANANSSEFVIFSNMLKAVMKPEYHDRIPAFLSIIVNYVEDPVGEKRRPWGPSAKGSGGPWTPKDPQDTR